MKITATQNGPLLIEISEATVKRDGNEEKLEGKMIALCRCGHSENKLFCDGSHKKANYEAESAEIELK